MMELQYRSFSLGGQFRKVQNYLFGETIKKSENQMALTAMYTRQNLQVGFGVLFPFTNNYKAVSYTHLRLDRKDISLAHSMISLGSCTMKLNAAAEMLPLSRP